jgi:hypothetical protein
VTLNMRRADAMNAVLRNDQQSPINKHVTEMQQEMCHQKSLTVESIIN